MDSPLFWLLVALSVPTTSIAHHGQVNLRSSWWQLIAMLQCSTGRSYSYNGYGCYCGLGGKGWPVDRMDWCCFNHDCCYRKAEAAGCRPKTQSYNWSCNRSTPSCWANNSRCQTRSCECDVVLSKCLKWANYQNKYAYYSNFRCGNSEPRC